ncbi:hypothetical protein PVOR_19709 [Paenibacillus vortex V453]|uniref:Uncharacterized protein n=2 Tax=Paenibacillus TaxID=44249 RepID=A0A163M2S9_9BACL|nr:hypothetical protein B9D94_14850 [Paenibacillus sp. Cedars]EFU40358.1 hypothetical protein PVOR_19709 [Paenibacillus vortex V453]KZS48694.1 hypothetical protein AWU65_23540 [Paenibacillus glucanolyticus]
MRFFIRLNVSSFLYAMFPFAVLELMANVYRISRVTGWELSHVNKLILAFCVAGITVSNIAFPKLIRHWLDGRKASYFSLILWFPYFVILVSILVSWLPITEPADQPNPVTGLIAMAALALYPFYLGILHLFGTTAKNMDR